MHVSLLSESFIYLSLALSFVIPILLAVWFVRKEKISWKTVGIGALTWFVMTQVFEKILHAIVLTRTPILSNPLLFALYGALVSGIFEEGGRYLAYSKFLKGKTKWRDGVGYGIGHGGVESLFIGVFGSLQLLVLMQLLNTNKLNRLKGMVPPQAIGEIKSMLLGPSYVFLLIGFERLMALALQIALSLVVLYAIKTKNIVFVLYAVLLHAAFDLAPAFYQTKQANLLVTEGIVAIFAIGSIIFIRRSKKLFN